MIDRSYYNLFFIHLPALSAKNPSINTTNDSIIALSSNMSCEMKSDFPLYIDNCVGGIVVFLNNVISQISKNSNNHDSMNFSFLLVTRFMGFQQKETMSVQ